MPTALARTYPASWSTWTRSPRGTEPSSPPPHHAFRTALVHSVADIPALVSEVDRLYVLLLTERRRHADLAAAARATLAATVDGEADPLAYLRDELAHGQHSGSRGRR